jgi:UDPglucose 6-dehydrogenase
MLIGVIGMGVVGDAVVSYLEEREASLMLYDKLKDFCTLDYHKKAQVVFVCVPTPYVAGVGFDASAVEESLWKLRPGKTVLIKSTLQPGTTERLQSKFPEHQIFFQPEFLREKTARQDFLEPDRQIIGYCGSTEEYARRLLELLPAAPYEAVLPATSAEVIKVATNAFLALKVAFANQLFDVSTNLDIDFDIVKEAVAADPRIGGSHLNVLDGGYRGYSGKCLPKDVQGLIDLSRELQTPFSVLESAQEYNDGLIRSRAADRSSS